MDRRELENMPFELFHFPATVVEWNRNLVSFASVLSVAMDYEVDILARTGRSCPKFQFSAISVHNSRVFLAMLQCSLHGFEDLVRWRVA